MIDLTASIEQLNAQDRTHVDLYYTGARLSDDVLITPGVLLDITDSPEKASPQTLAALSRITKGNSVILKTGWERHRGMPEYNANPWIDKNLIEQLVQRGASLILVDSPGVYGGAAGPEHNEMDKYLADHHAHAVENIVNLNLISAPNFRLYCFPIYAAQTNAAPCRVLVDLDGCPV